MRARSKNSKDDSTSTNFTWPINPPSEKEEDTFLEIQKYLREVFSALGGNFIGLIFVEALYFYTPGDN